MAEAVSAFVGDRGLHVLFNNAGVYPPGSLESLSAEEWDRVFAVNARGPFLVTQAVLPLLTAAEDARVINIGTVMAYRGAPGNLHYAAAKASLIGFTRVLARELAPRGITVNMIVPSMVETETAETRLPGHLRRDRRRPGRPALPAAGGPGRAALLPRLAGERLRDRPDDPGRRRARVPVTASRHSPWPIVKLRLVGIRVGIDTGGTFTDLVAVDDEGRSFLAKVPSEPGRSRRARSPPRSPRPAIEPGASRVGRRRARRSASTPSSRGAARGSST